MNIIRDLTQGTPEWRAVRKGKPSASRFSDIITAAKGDLSKSADGYIRELIGECYCPEWEYIFPTAAMKRGIELEPEARQSFSEMTGLVVDQVGFVIADDGVCGCSPDGLISMDGQFVAGLEIKCPSPKEHVGYVLGGALPDTYKQQVHGSMAVTGLPRWHFFSYFPGMQPLHVIIERDDYTEKMCAALATFVEQYRTTMISALAKLQLPEWTK